MQVLITGSRTEIQRTSSNLNLENTQTTHVEQKKRQEKKKRRKTKKTTANKMHSSFLHCF